MGSPFSIGIAFAWGTENLESDLFNFSLKCEIQTKYVCEGNAVPGVLLLKYCKGALETQMMSPDGFCQRSHRNFYILDPEPLAKWLLNSPHIFSS